MNCNIPNNSITYFHVILKSNHCIVYKVSDKDTFYSVKVRKRMRHDDIQIIKAIMVRRKIFKEDSKGSINFFQYSIRQSIIFSCQVPYYQTHDIFKQVRRRQESISKIVEVVFRGEVFYLYSYENLFYSKQTNSLLFNPTSTAGLISIIVKKAFTRVQFKQVFQLLDQKMFEEQDRWNSITYKSKFKAIAMFTLHIILERRVTLLKQSDLIQEQISFQKARRLIEQVPDRFRKLLRGKGVAEKIKKAEEEDKVNYLLFLRRVFEDNCQGLEWKQVVSLLFNQYKPKTDKNLRNFLDIFTQRLFSIEGEFSQTMLIQYGLAQKKIQYAPNYKEIIQSKIFFLDSDLYLQFLLSAASFNFKSVADQISQQKYMKQDNATIVNEMAILIRKLLAFNICFEYIQPQQELQFIYSDVVMLPTSENYFEKSLKKIQQTRFGPDLRKTEYSYILEKMVKNFKTYFAQVKSSKIMGLDNQMKTICKFLQL